MPQNEPNEAVSIEDETRTRRERKRSDEPKVVLPLGSFELVCVRVLSEDHVSLGDVGSVGDEEAVLFGMDGEGGEVREEMKETRSRSKASSLPQKHQKEGESPIRT